MAEPLVPESQLWGAERDEALAEFNRQITEWGLSMPDADPLVLYFGVEEFRKLGLIEYWVANEEEAGYCGKFLFVFDGQRCPYHHHDVEHETFFVVKGKVKMVVDDKEKILQQGDILVMPPGCKHSFEGVGNALLLEASMPCVISDNFFADKRIAGYKAPQEQS